MGIPNITAENRQVNLTPPFMRMDVDDSLSVNGNGDKFLQFLEAEVIPYMSKRYNASAMRSLSGNSRGGLLVMYSLLYKPKLFQGRFCYGTPFWRQHDMLTQQVEQFLTSSDTLHTFVYLSAGADETEKHQEWNDAHGCCTAKKCAHRIGLLFQPFQKRNAPGQRKAINNQRPCKMGRVLESTMRSMQSIHLNCTTTITADN